MRHDPDKHHRQSIRLRGYDYTSGGAYFVTACVQQRQCLFGSIADGQPHLNTAGQMVEKWWAEIPCKFLGVTADVHVVMPNHFHGVIVLEPASSDAPALGRVLEWFKTMTTNQYIRGVKSQQWQPFPGKLWQRNYYERIIRDEQEWHQLCRYIAENPAHWASDEEYPDAV